MNPTPPPTPAAALVALLLGVALLIFTTYLAARRGAGTSSFGWAVVNGLSFALLGMAAALRAPESQGLIATVAQLVALVAAVLLGVLCAPRAGSTMSAGGRVGPAGRFLAWLTLIGLPPTPGFHAKVLLCRSLLNAHWPEATALVLLASWVLLIPAMREARALQPGEARRARVLLIVLLVVLLI